MSITQKKSNVQKLQDFVNSPVYKEFQFQEDLKLALAIKEEREKRGLSQRDLAEIMQVPQSTVVRIEKTPEKISFTTFLKFCEVLDLEPRIEFV